MTNNLTPSRTPPFFLFLLLAGVLLCLGACSTVGGWFDKDETPPLEGERISVLALQSSLTPDRGAEEEALVLPEPWRNEYWPQAGGYPNHSMQHLALNAGALAPLWEAKIGRGEAGVIPLSAQPIVAAGMVFTLDTESRLSAFRAEDGKGLWEIDIRPAGEDDPVAGGGLSYAGGRLYATSGYNELLALEPKDGTLLWRKTLPAPAQAAPTIMEGRIFVTTIDNRLLAMEVQTGAPLWDYEGVSETAALVGAASPAAVRDVVVPAFSSGEIYALRVENGAVAWSDNLSSFRPVAGLAGLTDISGLPVIDRDLVIAISFGGKMTAIDARTGARVWQRDIGGAQTPWVAGDTLFVLSSENEVVALDRASGFIRWVSPLPRYRDPEKRKDPLFWTGPLLAGGRLLMAGTNGDVVALSPTNGDILTHWHAGSSFTVAPVVAGE
ncbi:MAG: PQQ-binding-like beta-propeller repeat protein, partial [Alphaproteobacteria bacterium]|nr:PQQ-binding-like beta-propeller repeat protein [Alphaproteobacteria bacterium]